MGEIIVFDAEADGLVANATGLHCICLKVLNSDKVHVYHEHPLSFPSLHDGSLNEGLFRVLNADRVIAHNGAAFDIPLFEKLGSGLKLQTLKKLSEGWMYDTMLSSMMLFPSRKKHSLESWFGDEKIQNEDWSVLTQNMLNRCISDVEITEELFHNMLTETERTGNDLVSAMRDECAFAYLMTYQGETGFRLDVGSACALQSKLAAKRLLLKEEVEEGAPKKIIPAYSTKYTEEDAGQLQADVTGKPVEIMFPSTKIPSWVKKLRTVKGTFTSVVTKWFDPQEQDYWNIQGPFTRIEYRKLNVNSPGQLKDFLYSLGWEPDEWNYKFHDGKKIQMAPKITESSMASIQTESGDGSNLGSLIKEYSMVTHRKNFMYNIRKDGTPGGILSYLRDDGRIPAGGFSIGTPTMRVRHRVVVNTPGVDADYGQDIRECFTVPAGFYLLGVDLSGIEARVLADLVLPFDGGKELADLILDGDFHQHNAEGWKVSRGIAKRLLYALMFGAGGKKLGDIAGRSEKKGDKIKDDFYRINPAIGKLIEAFQKDFDLGKRFITILDGRHVECLQKHKLLNRAIQSTAAVIFKRWIIKCHLELPELRTLKVRMIINVHDEMELESSLSYEHSCDVLNDIVEMIPVVGKELGIKVKLDGEGKIGKTWADVH